MNKNSNNFFSVAPVLLIFALYLIQQTQLLCSDKPAEILSLDYPNDKYIYFGVLRQGDSAFTSFILKNLKPEIPLQMLKKSPTLIRDISPNSSTDIDYLSFEIQAPLIFPIVLNQEKTTDILTMKFMATSSDSKGRKEARLRLGFTTLGDTVNTVFIDTFYLVGKYTELAIDGYDDYVIFDSVFIKQTKPITKIWKAKNTTKQSLNAVGQIYNLISTSIGKPFYVEEKKYPITFAPGDNKIFNAWSIEYNPKYARNDTAMLKLLFNPKSDEPDKIDTAKVTIYGTGVEQYFEIVDTANCGIYSDTANYIDTIDIGKVRVDEQKTLKVTLRNMGNIKYGQKKQYIYDSVSDEVVDCFQITRKFCELNTKLDVTDKDYFEITFKPKYKGKFIARYILENDFKDRKIRSNNAHNYKKVYVLTGTGVEPILTLKQDTIDFGNVNYANSNIECLTEKDTIITLINSGNSELIINDIKIDDPAFTAQPSDVLIPANSEMKIKVKFTADPPERALQAKLSFVTNERKPNNNSIVLFARSIPPIEAIISIPQLSNKPGTILDVPIFLNVADKNTGSGYGNSYSLDLRYNPTMLEYTNKITLNTASEGCNVIVDPQERGLLKITTNKEFSYFLENKVLLILQFKTFLGNSDTTELALVKAKIGNNSCKDFMKLNIQNGRYSIDSICGLGYKLNNVGAVQYNFNVIQNEISDNNIDFRVTLPFENDATVTIYNNLGDELFKESYLLSAGTFSKTLHFNNLHSGIYYLAFSSGLYQKVVPFIYMNHKNIINR